MHRHQHRPAAPVVSRRRGHPLARVALGATLALALLSAGFYVVAPLIDPGWHALVAGASSAASAVISQPLPRGGS